MPRRFSSKSSGNMAVSRRAFLKTTAAVFTILPAGSARTYAANEKVDVAVIGAWGQGSTDTKGVSDAGANIVALCDVDSSRLQAAAAKYPGARTYADFRQMLDKEHQHLNGVVVATPDNCHAVASVAAMRLGLHCYCEKPLTHDAHEARVMAQVAAEKKLITQIGSPLICESRAEGYRKQCEQVLADAVGGVVESHVAAGEPPCVFGAGRPPGEDPVPPNLNWDLWLGPAPYRPFVAKWPEDHPVRKQWSWEARKFVKQDIVYHPFVWRGWWDFGTGNLGDTAAHGFNQAFYTLELDQPTAVEVLDCSAFTDDMHPETCVIRWDFPARGRHPPLKLFWYQGQWRESEWLAKQGGRRESGWVYAKQKPEQLDAASGGGMEAITRDWIEGIRANRNPAGHFGFSARIAIAMALANIAIRTRSRIEWDPAAFRITNNQQANQYLQREYRKGWEL